MDWLGQFTPYTSFAYRTLAWWFLPNIATNALLGVYYQLLLLVGLSHWVPASDSPKRLEHHRRMFALVVLSYLSYTLALSLQEQPPSFYSLLGVDYHASDAQIKTAYRSFARRNHPDRVGPAGEPLFIQVRDAYEALKHPIKRYGYDRFGFDALEWKVAENPHAMLWQGLESAMRYYLPTGIIMLVMAIMVGEEPAPTLNFYDFVPSFAPYQWSFFLRETFVSLAVAIGVVVPVVFPPPPTKKEEQARQAEIAKLAIGLHPVVRDLIVQSAMSDVQAKELVQKEIRYLDAAPIPLTETQLTDAHRDALATLAPPSNAFLFNKPSLQEELDAHASHNNAFADRLTPASEDSINNDAMDDATAARLLAIPSPPSSIFSPSRDATPEASYARTFDINTPGFNWRSSPSGTPTFNRATSSAATHGISSPAPTSKGIRRPSLSPSKRPSRLLEAGLASPTSPSTVLYKEELA
ncbi:DnaJ molecular chaperone homology domain [Rhizoctonia solani]|uniref:DnaJ molecular chaperone homology domain n=1 Tax=Rhizoctonia solani TaxID=456999 RepID=A0A8H7IAA3_9AGAM|nr:DnaJ molecular chaperone homology domain [Rhizoctonia solani]